MMSMEGVVVGGTRALLEVLRAIGLEKGVFPIVSNTTCCCHSWVMTPRRVTACLKDE